MRSCATKTEELLTHEVNAKRTSWTYGRDEFLSSVAEITGARPENQIRKTKSQSHYHQHSTPAVQFVRNMYKQLATQTFLVLGFLHTKLFVSSRVLISRVTDEYANNSPLHKEPVQVNVFAALA